ncbi:MAG: hypothetical protein IAE99_07310 [Rhodothermales bacterium]|nr:hypothetical protein [Rhodothermales bacterium]
MRPHTAFRFALGVLHAGMWATLVANRIVLKRTPSGHEAGDSSYRDDLSSGALRS